MKNVLILDAQAVQTLIIAKKLYESNFRVFLACDDKWTYGYHTKYAQKAFVAPHSNDIKKYKEFIINLIKLYKIDVLIPMTDDSARFLSLEKLNLLQLVHFIIPNIDIFDKGYDKQQLMAVCSENNFPHPKTINLEIDSNKAETFLYPALIKPNHMTGGRGMTLVHSYDDFNNKYPYVKKNFGPCHLQEFIPVGGRQIEVQVFMNEHSEVIASSVINKYRYYPENGGSSCSNITIKDDNLVNLCANVMRKIGWTGFADFDTIEDPRDGVIKIMELNPRVPACVKSAILSGPDYATMIAKASLGYEIEKVHTYNPGFQLRHIGFEVLWFIYSKNRFRTKPNWFKFFGKKLYFQDFSWDDPVPFFFGTIGNIRKQLNPEFRKKKSGLR